MNETYFPDNLYLPISEGREIYERLVSIGFERMRKYRVAICTLLRDNGDSLPRLLKRIEKLSSYFDDWTLFAYENDSTDKTVILMEEWLSKNRIKIPLSESKTRHWFKSERLNAPKFGHVVTHERFERMAYYRNQYLTALQPVLDVLDYVIIIDSDLEGGFSYEGVCSSFGIDDFDMIGSNGLSHTGTFGPQWIPHYFDTLATEFYDNRIAFIPHRRGECIIPVKSCFGGLGIYRSKCLKGLSYTSMFCDHNTIAEQMRQRNYNKIFINPSQIVVYDFPANRRW